MTFIQMQLSIKAATRVICLYDFLLSGTSHLVQPAPCSELTPVLHDSQETEFFGGLS